MKIPKFAQDIMSRSEFDLTFRHPRSEPGYTIKVKKATPYTQAATLHRECERLVAWAKRNYAEGEILDCPIATHHCNQYALVTIFDPCMKFLEQYMPKKG